MAHMIRFSLHPRIPGSSLQHMHLQPERVNSTREIWELSSEIFGTDETAEPGVIQLNNGERCKNVLCDISTWCMHPKVHIPGCR